MYVVEEPAAKLTLLPRRFRNACESCNGAVVVWIRAERRDNAWRGTCRRCGVVYLDFSNGEILEV